MNQLPTSFTKHPFFRTTKAEMSEKALFYKDKMDNYSQLTKKQQFSVFKELLDLNFSWPDPLRQEGFWCLAEEKDFLFKEYPYPQANQLAPAEITEFLDKLTRVEKKTTSFSYLGFSHCRICNQRNGTKTYYTNLFAWPEGYKHYIRDHGVMPSAAFVLHIRGLIN